MPPHHFTILAQRTCGFKIRTKHIKKLERRVVRLTWLSRQADKGQRTAGTTDSGEGTNLCVDE